MDPVLKKFWTRFAFATAGGMILLHLSCGPPVYYAPPITATVIDEETGKPLEGAVVIAEWPLYSFNMRQFGFMSVQEAITDRNGRFVIDGWGPKLRPPTYWLEHSAPVLSIYKPGYTQGGGTNQSLDPNFGSPIIRRMSTHSLWNGKVLPLPRATTVEQELQTYNSFRSDLVFFPGDPRTGFPRAVMALRDGYYRLPIEIRQRDVDGTAPPP